MNRVNISLFFFVSLSAMKHTPSIWFPKKVTTNIEALNTVIEENSLRLVFWDKKTRLLLQRPIVFLQDNSAWDTKILKDLSQLSCVEKVAYDGNFDFEVILKNTPNVISP